MNLKDLLTSKDSPPELFWALVIEKGLVQSGIWYIGENTAEVVGIGTGIPWESESDLIEATDAALSSAIQKLPEDYPEPQKTVFGVTTSWVKDGEISPENLDRIKKICTELSLTPVGFVVLPEAIAHYYKSIEGSPLNAIVLKSGNDSLEMSIFKLGELSGNTEIQRSVSLVDDVVEGLSRFSGISPLPTRFIIYDGKEGALEETEQTLIQADWGSKKVSFLHTPQVEILPTDKKVLATALAGGAELGSVTSVVNNEGDLGEESNESKTVENLEQPGGSVDLGEDNTKTAEDFGFAMGTDISALEQKDVENIIPVPPVINPVQDTQIPAGQPQYQVQNNIVQQPLTPQPKQRIDYLAKGKSLFHSFSKIIPKSNMGGTGKNKGLIAILSVIGVLFVSLISLWWFAQKANVSIYVTPQRAEENVQIVFDTNGSADIANGVIPAVTLVDKVSGDKTKSTTGTKLIGNKATGNVQIANGNSAAINLASGAILTSSSGFKFVTSSEVSVSGQLLPGSPGTASVDVAAYDIGSQYNLAKGEVFSVGNYSKSLVAATSTVDFTGGSSQQISAVSKDDQTALETDLKNELIQNAKSDLSAKMSDTQTFVSDLAAIDTVTETFDHKVGDQADNLKLSLSLNATALAADKEKLLEYANNTLKGKAPTGYTLSSDHIDFKFTLVSEDNGKYTYNVVVGGNFLPEVDVEKIKKTILGKTATVATDYLNSITGFDHAEVTLKIKFPGPLKTIPRIAKNIVIEVKPE